MQPSGGDHRPNALCKGNNGVGNQSYPLQPKKNMRILLSIILKPIKALLYPFYFVAMLALVFIILTVARIVIRDL